MIGVDLMAAAGGIVPDAEAALDGARKVGAKVSPWLWVLSIGAFTMAALNFYRIGHMFGNYKGMKAALWKR